MKEIAAVLGLSTRTVETHKDQSLEALGLRTTGDLIPVRHRARPRHAAPTRVGSLSCGRRRASIGARGPSCTHAGAAYWRYACWRRWGILSIRSRGEAGRRGRNFLAIPVVAIVAVSLSSRAAAPRHRGAGRPAQASRLHHDCDRSFVLAGRVVYEAARASLCRLLSAGRAVAAPRPAASAHLPSRRRAPASPDRWCDTSSVATVVRLRRRQDVATSPL